MGDIDRSAARMNHYMHGRIGSHDNAAELPVSLNLSGVQAVPSSIYIGKIVHQAEFSYQLCKRQELYLKLSTEAYKQISCTTIVAQTTIRNRSQG